MINLPVHRALTWFLLALVCIGGLLATAPFWGHGLLQRDFAIWTAPIVGTPLGLAAFVTLCVLVRCRNCGYKLFWHAVQKQEHPGGLNWFLVTGKSCPRCATSGG